MKKFHDSELQALLGIFTREYSFHHLAGSPKRLIMHGLRIAKRAANDGRFTDNLASSDAERIMALAHYLLVKFSNKNQPTCGFPNAAAGERIKRAYAAGSSSANSKFNLLEEQFIKYETLIILTMVAAAAWIESRGEVFSFRSKEKEKKILENQLAKTKTALAKNKLEITNLQAESDSLRTTIEKLSLQILDLDD